MSEIEISVENGVQAIRMNRPEKKNAITASMYGHMAQALNAGMADAAVRVSVLLGVPGIFTSGNDIGDFLKMAMSGQRESMAVFDFLEAIILSRKPLVAGVDGIAIGVGTTMLMHCDHVLASPRSTFRTPFVELGLLPEAGSSLIAPQIMGHHRAFAMLAMGETFSAEAACAAGLVNRVVAEGELEAAAMETARNLASLPPEALSISRDLVRGDRSPVLARMREEARLWEARLASDEAKQAFMAFMAKGQKKSG